MSFVPIVEVGAHPQPGAGQLDAAVLAWGGYYLIETPRALD